MTERIYGLHCQGKSISQIADKLKTDAEVVRETIVGQWYKEKHEFFIAERLKIRRRFQ